MTRFSTPTSVDHGILWRRIITDRLSTHRMRGRLRAATPTTVLNGSACARVSLGQAAHRLRLGSTLSPSRPLADACKSARRVGSELDQIRGGTHRTAKAESPIDIGEAEARAAVHAFQRAGLGDTAGVESNPRKSPESLPSVVAATEFPGSRW